jgi:phospholipase C
LSAVRLGYRLGVRAESVLEDSGRALRLSRRAFLGASVAAAAATMPGLAACSSPRPKLHGELHDVEHVVILMQENRSFDHYFGTMRGVRGYSDRTALLLPSGNSVFHQPDPKRPDGGYILPFHVDTARVDGQGMTELDHSWNGTHDAWNRGGYDDGVAAKTDLAMGYFEQADIPFHRALAAGFTICDNYFCSVQGPTIPNRLYLWTGMIDPSGTAGGPAIGNPEKYVPVYDWTTYPERLQKAGISWQVYANDEVGSQAHHPFVGDSGFNPLWHFRAFHNALAARDSATRQLAERASLRTNWKPDSGLGKSTDHVLAQFIADCRAGSLPAVSWVVTPYGYTEHPAARPVDGAAYVQRMLRAIWDNPALWERTVVLINYDENDGFFDHVIPPVAPAGTPDEYVRGRPIGLGPRTPLLVISPWSTGGYVCSQVFDHTSILRFLEAWTGVRESNISAWRRSICGDLLSCFDFGAHRTSIPTLPDTSTLRAAADRTEAGRPRPEPPDPGRQQPPVQEPGSAPARPIPYQPVVSLTASALAVVAALANLGDAALQFAVYAHHLPGVPPQRVDVAPRGTGTARVRATDRYHVAVHGPNGFLAEAIGDAASGGVEVSAELSHVGGRPKLILRASNSTARPVTLTGASSDLQVAARGRAALTLDPSAHASGWYDQTLVLAGHPTWSRRFAGHLETGRPSRTA